jgi:hypothetical protein
MTVDANGLVVDRLDFVKGLEAILFQPEALKERTQLHRILVKNTWLFGEEYHITVDDQDLTEVLRRHLHLFGKHRKSLVPVTAKGTPDMMLSRRIPQSRPQDIEHLVIELKSPKVKIDEKVVGQLKKYARAVAADDRFKHTKAKWIFIAVSNQFGDDVESDYFGQEDRPDGLVMNKELPSIQMWVRTWGQLIEACRARLQFIQERLGYMADEEAQIDVPVLCEGMSTVKQTEAIFNLGRAMYGCFAVQSKGVDANGTALRQWGDIQRGEYDDAKAEAAEALLFNLWASEGEIAKWCAIAESVANAVNPTTVAHTIHVEFHGNPHFMRAIAGVNESWPEPG